MSELATGSAKAEASLRLLHYAQMADYFLDKGHAEYSKTVQELEKSLVAIQYASMLEVPQYTTIRLPLRPRTEIPFSFYEQKSKRAKEATDGLRVYYEDDVPAETKDLLLMNELITHSQVLDDARDEKGDGEVLSRGFYDETTLYFVEQYGEDSVGKYLTWSATNLMPKSFIAKPKAMNNMPFLTSKDRNDFANNIFDSIDELPTATIDESEVVRTWIHRKAA